MPFKTGMKSRIHEERDCRFDRIYSSVLLYAGTERQAVKSSRPTIPLTKSSCTSVKIYGIKWASYQNRSNMRMASKHMERSSTSLIITE